MCYWLVRADKNVSDISVYQITFLYNQIMNLILKLIDLLGLSFVCIFLDVSSNQVTFRIQEQWDQKYSDPTTKEYGNLKQQMVEEVNEIN